MKTQKYRSIMLGYQLNLSNLFLASLIMLCFNFSVFALQEKEDLFGIEKIFKTANNNQDYFVVKKQDWEELKENVFSESKTILKNQDSLSKTIAQQQDSIINLKNLLNQKDQPINQEVKRSYFPWVLTIIFGISVLFTLFHLARIYSKMNDAYELYVAVDESYENSKKHWIEKERQLKRELIDVNAKLEEVTKNNS